MICLQLFIALIHDCADIILHEPKQVKKEQLTSESFHFVYFKLVISN